MEIVLVFDRVLDIAFNFSKDKKDQISGALCHVTG